jgi:HSP20 family molecular chaperone IbpA
MSTDLFANRIPSTNGAAVAVPLREMLGYDPFRRFLPNVDPEMEVVRTENGWDVEIPVPGYRPDQIDIVVKDDVLTVSGKSEKRAFTRSLRLPQEIDTENIEATVEYGMLALSLQRHPDAEPRKIQVKQRTS